MIQLVNTVIPNSYINNNIVSKIQSQIGEVYKKQFLKTSNTRRFQYTQYQEKTFRTYEK